MKILVNGGETEIPDGLTVTKLLEHQQVKMPDMVSVELNGEILQRDTFATSQLKAGDRVEFLYFMGGGSR